MLSSVLLVAKLALIAVFAVSGVTKLLDRRGSREALRGFGVPAAATRSLGYVLPLAELAIAATLLTADTARWAAAAALLLLGLFVAAIASAMARGREPDCHCFGQLHSAPAGPAALARNVGLASVACVIIVAGPGPALVGSLGWPANGELGWLVGGVAAGTLIAQAAVIVTLLGRHGRVLVRLEELEGDMASSSPPGLAVGEPAPEFEARDLDGATVGLTDLLTHRRPVLLVFTDPACVPCQALLPTIAGWQEQHAGILTVALISSGDPAHNHRAAEYRLLHVALQEDRGIQEQYRVVATPTAVLVGIDGRVALPSASGADNIATLVDREVSAAAALGVRGNRLSHARVAAGAGTVVGAGALSAAPIAEAAAFPAALSALLDSGWDRFQPQVDKFAHGLFGGSRAKTMAALASQERSARKLEARGRRLHPRTRVEVKRRRLFIATMHQYASGLAELQAGYGATNQASAKRHFRDARRSLSKARRSGHTLRHGLHLKSKGKRYAVLS